MHKAKRKSVPTKGKKTLGEYIRIALFVFVIGGFLYTIMSQQLYLNDIRKKNEQCKKEIAQKEKEYEVLKQKSEYNASDDFYEKKARDEGYVLEDETVFVVGN